MNQDLRLRETERFLYEQIPLTRAMEVSVESADNDQLTLTAPLAANHNHLGTAFGGSLAALAMLAGYCLLWLELDDRTAHLVVSESVLHFRRPVRGELRATCHRPKEISAFRSNFVEAGKGRLQLQVEILSEGEVAVVFTGTYVARRSSPAPTL